MATGASGNTFGVQGISHSSTGLGVAGHSGPFFGAQAISFIGTTPVGVLGDSNGIGVLATSDSSNALIAQNNSTSDTLVSINKGGGFPLFVAGTGAGGVFVDANNNLNVSGAISAGTKDFKIDHPLDPANKYLYHASVESSEMMNIYTGNVTTDAQGHATVELPEWFEAVNADFRYQLTVIGQFAQAIVATKIANNHFAIRTDKPNVEVSWQVTGVRHDAFAKAHRLQVSVDKPTAERGFYLHPELFGAPAEKSVTWARRPERMKSMKAQGSQLAPSIKQ